MSGYTVTAQMRKHAGSSTAIYFSTSVVVPSSNGEIILSLNSTQTANIKPGRYVYDVLIEKDGSKTRVVEGMVLVREGVTR